MSHHVGTISQRLREAREAKGWSRDALEKAANVGKGYVNQIERGARLPKPSTTEKLARALGVDPRWLVGELGTTPLAGRAEQILRTLQIPDPLGFLERLATLPATDQHLVADHVTTLAVGATWRKLLERTEAERPQYQPIPREASPGATKGNGHANLRQREDLQSLLEGLEALADRLYSEPSREPTRATETSLRPDLATY